MKKGRRRTVISQAGNVEMEVAAPHLVAHFLPRYFMQSRIHAHTYHSRKCIQIFSNIHLNRSRANWNKSNTNHALHHSPMLALFFASPGIGYWLRCTRCGCFFTAHIFSRRLLMARPMRIFFDSISAFSSSGWNSRQVITAIAYTHETIFITKVSHLSHLTTCTKSL